MAGYCTLSIITRPESDSNESRCKALASGVPTAQYRSASALHRPNLIHWYYSLVPFRMATYTVNIFSAVSFSIFCPLTYLIGNDTPPLEFDCKGCENLVTIQSLQDLTAKAAATAKFFSLSLRSLRLCGE